MIMANNVDDRDESFISKFRDSFIEEDDADSAASHPMQAYLKLTRVLITLWRTI